MGDPSDSSSGEEDGDVAWRAAIDSVTTTTSTYVSSIINGSSDMAAKQRLTSADDCNDCRNQKLKHYQIKQMLMLHCSNKWKLASFGGLRMANLFSCTFHCLISQKAIILWTYDPCERDAKLAREALENSKKSVEHLKMIVEMSCASSPDHSVGVRQAYTSLLHCSLEEDIASNVSPSSLAKLLVAVVSSYRYDRDEVDSAIANSEATKLHEAIKTKQLDDDHVNWILSTRNFYQLRETFACYKTTYGNLIAQDILSCGNGKFESVLKVIICCLDSPEKHFAEVIRDSIVGFGTDEDSLTRAIVSRAEIDLMKVREEYQNLYKTSLDDAVVGDTSGDYEDFLMTLLGARN